MATFVQLQTAVALKIGIDVTDTPQLTVLKEWINQGVRDVLLRTKCYVKPATLALTADEGDYDLDTTILQMNEMYVTDGSSQNWNLERVTPADILKMRRATTATDTVKYYAVDGANLLMVYPIPGSTPGSVTMYYVPLPDELVADSDDPSTTTLGGIPREFHKLIEKYALMEAADYDDDISSQVGRKYMEEYERELRLARGQMLNKGGRRKLGRIIVNRGRRSVVPPTPSHDV